MIWRLILNCTYLHFTPSKRKIRHYYIITVHTDSTKSSSVSFSTFIKCAWFLFYYCSTAGVLPILICRKSENNFLRLIRHIIIISESLRRAPTVKLKILCMLFFHFVKHIYKRTIFSLVHNVRQVNRRRLPSNYVIVIMINIVLETVKCRRTFDLCPSPSS